MSKFKFETYIPEQFHHANITMPEKDYQRLKAAAAKSKCSIRKLATAMVMHCLNDIEEAT